ncbi:M20 metallopeptidase family protein [Microvirga brassicacearum]|uniref:Amidohydrolase n=1 Tax=Microvirga brassicacearum TaxID=2580413 RepID=A0A5N3P737_9HYPH|nr:M20 family metallopeptidase [Microvirga brassicacearum]KAB0265536.1 amidohydrolase [Microvirga brassicacearum]
MTHMLNDEIDRIVSQIEPDLIAIRRQIHANPELSLEEFETARLVEEQLGTLGIDHVRRFGGTGIAAIVGTANGLVVGIRGDMDALPIQEESGAPYASTRPGVSHACGHDAHTAIVLGVARVMHLLKDKLPGRAMLVFQPAEEGHGGAAAMIEDGVLEWGKPDVMLGFHNWPLLPPGTVGWHPSASFASSDRFTATLTGVSGHGAHPHLARDVIVAAAHFIGEAQTIVSREIAPLQPAVVSFGSINGGTAGNQLPDRVVIVGTARCHSDDVRKAIQDALVRIGQGVALSHRVECRVSFDSGSGPVVNDPRVLSTLVRSCEEALGSPHVYNLGQGTMGAEDFSEFSSRVPSAHIRVGSKRKDRETMLHRSNFDLDEACIAISVRCLCYGILRLMNSDEWKAI